MRLREVWLWKMNGLMYAKTCSCRYVYTNKQSLIGIQITEIYRNLVTDSHQVSQFLNHASRPLSALVSLCNPSKPCFHSQSIMFNVIRICSKLSLLKPVQEILCNVTILDSLVELLIKYQMHGVRRDLFQYLQTIATHFTMCFRAG